MSRGLYKGKCHPVVWSKNEGNGKVVHITLGHEKKVWQLPNYQQLVLQSVNWFQSI